MKKLILILAVVALGACGKGNSQDSIPVAPGADMTANPVHDAHNPPKTSNGPVGIYGGVLVRQSGTQVPLELDIDVNPSGGSNQLRASMKVGVFGGVSVGSSSVVWDWEHNLVTVNFGANANSLTFVGNLSDKGFTNATLRGARTSARAELKYGEEAEFSSTGQIAYDVSFPSAGKAKKGALVIIPHPESVPGGDFSDLPALPGLSANFQFTGWEGSPNIIQRSVYDPLTGEMDLFMNGNTKLVFYDIENGDISGGAPGVMKGEVRVGGGTVATLLAAQSGASDVGIGTQPAVRYFRGTYTGQESYLHNTAMAMLEPLNTEGQNPTDSVFPTFPRMTLTVILCEDQQEVGRMVFDAFSMNPVTGKAVFRMARGGRNADFDASYSPGWGSLSGQIHGARSSQGSGGSLSKLSLSAISQKHWKTCGK